MDGAWRKTSPRGCCRYRETASRKLVRAVAKYTQKAPCLLVLQLLLLLLQLFLLWALVLLIDAMAEEGDKVKGIMA